MPRGASRRSVRLLSLLLALCLAAFGVGGCGGDKAGAPVVLDGSPRVADDEGVVTELDLEGKSVTLDGERSFQVSEQVRSFSALDLSIQPLADAEGSYVQVGLDGETVVWLGRIARVVPTKPPRVFYVGRFTRIEDSDKGRRAVFGEGTVLSIADGVEPPAGAEGHVVQAEIDPEAHRVTALRAG